MEARVGLVGGRIGGARGTSVVNIGEEGSGGG